MRKDQRLRLWQKSGWTYRGLSEETGIPHTTLSRSMQGLIKRPSDEVREALARAVGVSADTLFPKPTLTPVAA
jgi:transcriptional regulator with XRE-family HTH domain